MAETAKRRGKLLAIIGFLLFGITILVGSLIMAAYANPQYVRSISFIIDSLLMVLVSPSLMIVGIIMYFYGVAKVRRSRTSEPVLSASVPARKPDEKLESDKGFTPYQKISLTVSVVSIIISVLLRLLVK